MEGPIVVLGTGTEIGKTEVSASLLRGARGCGHQVAGLKPVLTGDDQPDDAARLGAAAGRVVAPRYRFAPPVSPHLAARQAGVTISLPEIGAWVAAHSAEVTVVETAGGVFSPISASLTNLDLAISLRPAAMVLVTSARLGVLHNVAATILAVRHIAPTVAWQSIVVSSPSDDLEVAVRELRDTVLPRVSCTAPVVGFGPSWSLTPQADVAFFQASLSCFT